MESFFHILKINIVHQMHYKTVQSIRNAVVCRLSGISNPLLSMLVSQFYFVKFLGFTSRFNK
ncbi:IS3 family transposase [Leuconostoc gelidum]|uniref:IS3 family transposase n=1 Tax=Leuconostoc gelidum TaxID=1244 RepID=UPI003570FCB8